jgi:hypothetical protein
MFRPALILALLLAAAAVGVPAIAQDPKPAAPAGFEQQFIYHSIKLPPKNAVRFSVTCPPGWTVQAGGLERDPATVWLPVSRVKAKSTRRWQFSAADLSGKEQTVTVWVACIRPKGAKRPPRFKVVRKDGILVVKQQISRPAALYCPPKYKPLGGTGERYVDVDLPGPRRVGVRAASAGDHPRITSAKPTRRGPDVTIRGGPSDTRATIDQGCYPDTFTTRRGGERAVTLDRNKIAIQAPPGASRVSADCGDGRIATGSSYSFDADADVVAAPSPGPDGDARLWVSNETARTVRGSFFVTCARGEVVKTRVTGIQVDTTTGPLTITQGDG